MRYNGAVSFVSEASQNQRMVSRFRCFWSGVFRAALSTEHTDPVDVIVAMFILTITGSLVIGTVIAVYMAVTG